MHQNKKQGSSAAGKKLRTRHLNVTKRGENIPKTQIIKQIQTLKMQLSQCKWKNQPSQKRITSTNENGTHTSTRLITTITMPE